MEILKTGDCKIVIGEVGDNLEEYLNKRAPSQIIFLVDENSRAYCLPKIFEKVEQLQNSLVLEISSGEEFKNLDTCQALWLELFKNNIDRNALWINLGGGVVCDLGGMVAAAFKRGISFINIPTTLLAQVDASVGGKVGVDFQNIKNGIGFFREAEAVFIYPEFLKTLAEDELLSGFAEMLKHGLIDSEKQWNELKSIDPLNEKADWKKLIADSINVKKNIVEKDPHEKDLRKALNFGHTLGHAFESASLHAQQKLLHGHAIAAGMLAECYLSHKLIGLEIKYLEDISENILHHFRKYLQQDIPHESWQKWITFDKKNAQGSHKFTLLKKPGEIVLDVNVEIAAMEDAVKYLKNKL